MATSGAMWTFCEIGLLVTGKGERAFLPSLFREVEKCGTCRVQVLRKIEQLSPRTSPKKRAKIVGTNKDITDRDFETIGVPARQHLNKERPPYKRAVVILIDDLESSRVDQAQGVFSRYREALDKALGNMKHLAAVHFLVNMLEAYYFADAAAINAVLGTQIADYTGDVEEIDHPKNRLKSEARSIDRSLMRSMTARRFSNFSTFHMSSPGQRHARRCERSSGGA